MQNAETIFLSNWPLEERQHRPHVSEAEPGAQPLPGTRAPHPHSQWGGTRNSKSGRVALKSALIIPGYLVSEPLTLTFKKHHLFLAPRYLAPESSLLQRQWGRSGGHRLQPAPSRDIVASVNTRHVCPTGEWAELILFLQRAQAALSGAEPTTPTAHRALLGAVDVACAEGPLPRSRAPSSLPRPAAPESSSHCCL